MSESTSQNRIKAGYSTIHGGKNAKKSAGPKTAKGKRNVRHNAVKHGLYSPDIIINSPHLKENAEEYDLLPASVMAELKPVGLLQECLVRKIADCLWRLGRRSFQDYYCRGEALCGTADIGRYSTSIFSNARENAA